MIKRLKLKFIILALVSIFLLLCVIIASMNIINYNSVVNEADFTLSILTKNRGSFPEFGDDKGRPMPHNMSPELPFESRYFSVLLNTDGDVIHTETSRIASVDTALAIKYAKKIFKNRNSVGFIENFRFAKTQEGNDIRITFLDYGRQLDSVKRFLFISITMALAGYIIVFLIILFFSGRFIRPIAESYEKQKRFITDAGHEIKTPLTVINANADILELDIGENECISDIKLQTERLTALTNDLVMLSRMEESANTVSMIDFPISEVILDAVTPFKNLAFAENKNFKYNIQPLITMKGNSKAIERLIWILLDNAIKYTPKGGNISLTFTKQAKSTILTAYNTTKNTFSKNDLSRVFDRFYRTDPSRNSETGGYGIGLSVAKAIVTSHAGKIVATAPDNNSFQITAIFPI